jgi:hypothetical protein
MDQSMVARFAKAAARQDELLSGGTLWEQKEKKKQREYDAIDKKWADEAKMDFLLKRDKQAQENDLAKQGLVNQGQVARAETVNSGTYDVAELKNQGVGRMARQGLGASSPNAAGAGDAMFKSWYEKEGSTQLLNPEQLNNKRMEFNKFFDGGNQQSNLNPSDIPTPEALQSAYYKGMNDSEFRGAIDRNENLRGMGYVQDIKTGKTVRVVNNEVYGPDESRSSARLEINKNPINNEPISAAQPTSIEFWRKGFSDAANKSTTSRATSTAGPGIEDPYSTASIDAQITEDENKRKLFDNKYMNWVAKRLRNISNAPIRGIGAGMYATNRVLGNASDRISNWKGWDE